MHSIYLIGFMGAGKSAVGRELQRSFGMKTVEMDALIEEREQMSISEIFRVKGEAYFRERETELLGETGSEEGLAISCGGGAALREENVAVMKHHGYVVYLETRPETVYERVKNSHSRPLLEGNMNIPYITSLIQKRRPFYEKAADITVRTDGQSPEEICREIMKEIRKTEGTPGESI